MSGKIWIVEQGDYSDYQLVGVFSTRENAELVAERINERAKWSPAEVVEMDLDAGAEDLRAGRLPYRVEMTRDGKALNVTEIGMLSEEDHTEPLVFEGYGSRPGRMQSWVWAKDEKHAVKIANEQRTQMIAEGKWPDHTPEA